MAQSNAGLKDQVPLGHQIKDCLSCKKEIAENTQAIFALGNNFHPECFTCCSCDARIESAYVDLGGRPFHKDCAMKMQEAEGPPRCAGCNEQLAEDEPCLRAGTRHFHQACLVCSVCDKAINDAFCNMDGKPTHRACLAQIGQSTCNVCKDKITDGEAIISRGLFFHSKCFGCAQCGKEIRDSCKELQGQVYHAECAEEIFPKDTVCGVCGKNVEIEGHVANAKWFHPECFRCGICHKNIQSGQKYRTPPGADAVHSTCHDQQLKEKEKENVQPSS
eukprot:NODE_1938_length_1245_cov_108.592809_g1607_i0.p2 GENE.NODE_1938_length_1245_cov_108.592809_g1607_i0~~NODE_1938_length_1245_cov_108.592809_g1607_i0.p2  ORF type:complete len:276 (+),score=61.11 NODE_1938_length_1245_cov_108.592809_g1607_i0:240-1067(+)